MDLSEVKDVFKDRLKNPFFGSVIIAFIACNWKAILALFYPQEDWTIFQRIKDIPAEFYPEPWSVPVFVYLLPVAVGVFAVTVLPKIITFLDRYNYGAIVKRKLKRLEMEAALPENLRQMHDLQNKNSGLEQEVGKLRNELKDLHEQETKKSLLLVRAYQAIVEYDPEIRRIMITLHKQPQALEQTKPLQLLMSLDLVNGTSTGKYELTVVGNGVAATQSAAGLPPQVIL